jgi:TolB-like protein
MKLSIHSFISIVILLPLSLIAYTPDSLNVAVNDLNGKGLDQSAASIISDRLRSELIATGVFRVMERNEMASILKEQGFQQTGACEEASCIVQVGQLLGVDRMVAGSIGKIDSLFTISVRMINVGTGQIMFSVDEDFQGDIFGVLSVAVGNAAHKLAAGAKGEISMAALVGRTGDLYIASQPDGATIEIDGKVVNGQTPVTLRGIPAGEHRIMVRKNDDYGVTTATIAPADLVKINLVLKKNHGAIKLLTTPVGALVIIDGILAGTSPLKIENLATGEHHIKISKTYFFAYESKFHVKNDQQTNLEVTLKPAASITVKCNQMKAPILVNGAEAGIGLTTRIDVPVGDNTIQAALPDFDPFKKTISLAQGEHLHYTINLKHSQAYHDSMQTQFKNTRWARRLIFGALAAAAWGGGAYMNSLYIKSDANQKRVQAKSQAVGFWTEYNTSYYNSQVEFAKDEERNRNIFYAIGTVFTLGFVISIPF